MGVFDKFKAIVLTEYKADTKQMRSELKKLSGEQKKQSDAAIAQADKQNKATDSQIAMLGKATVAVGAVVAAYKLAEVGIEAFQKRSRLNASTAGVDLAGLQKATNGLVSETRLLEFASKAMNGTFKLSQSQMEQAVTGAVALRKTLGVDLQKALEVTQKSITEGTTEPLKELGLVVKGVENDTREGLNAALKELAQQAKLAGPDLRIPGDEMAASQIEMTDAVDELKISLGQLVISLGPVLSSLAEMVGLLGKASSFLFEGDNLFEQAQKAAFDQSFIGKAINPIIAQREASERLVSGAMSVGRFLNPKASASAAVSERSRAGSRRQRAGATSRNGTPSGIDIIGPSISAVTGIGSGIGGYFDSVKANAAASEEQFQGIKAEDREAYIRLIEETSTLAAMAQEQEGSVMSSIFGTPAEIDTQTVALQQLGGAMDGLAGAFGAGVDAMITGSEGFATAFKDAIGESLRAMAIDMTIRSFREAAMGIGQLAIGNLASAAAHGKAAAAYGAGAVAAGVGARMLGAGQTMAARSPATAGTAGIGTTAPRNDNSGGNTKIIVLGDDYGTLSARERESRIRETMRGAGISATGDFVVNG